MSEDNSFSIGVFPEGQHENKPINAEYLTDKGFESTDDTVFGKPLEPGRILQYNLSTGDILMKKGDDEPIHIAGPADKAYLEGLYKILTGVNL